MSRAPSGSLHAMDTGHDTDALARAVIDGCAYMTLATADERGTPWATPVWFAHEDHRRFLWVSDPAARHSRNLAARADVSVAIFDSHAPIGTGQGVYLAGTAQQLAGPDLAHGIGVFSRRSLAQGGRAWTPDDVGGDARLRLYRMTAAERWIGNREDRRILLTG